MGQTLVDVGIFCERLLEVAQSFDDRGYLPDQRTISAVGSSFVDIVVDVLGTDRRNELLLRSGCYVTHDHGSYGARSAFDGCQPCQNSVQRSNSWYRWFHDLSVELLWLESDVGMRRSILGFRCCFVPLRPVAPRLMFGGQLAPEFSTSTGCLRCQPIAVFNRAIRSVWAFLILV
jgi:hypothetical protein